MNYIGLNQAVIAAQDARVSVMDHGLMYGIGLFETFRTYGGEPFLLERHVERLAEGCKQLGIPYECDYVALRDWIRRVMEQNGLADAYIRYTVTAGEDILGLPAGDYRKPNQLLYIKALPPFPDRLYTEGKLLQLLALRRNTPEGPVRMKSLHYMNNILAKRELATYASAAEGAEGLMLTSLDQIAEGIVSNVFWVRDKVLYTPGLNTGILPGITREMVIELAESAGISLEEGLYSWEQLRAADEIFLTNSVQGVVPVKAVCGGDRRDRIGAGSCGPLTGEIIKLYRERIESIK